jgi:rubrerythrin
MHKMTQENLERAFAGESMAHMRYLVFSEKAAQDGYPNLSRLFRAIAFAEEVHATNHYRELGMIQGAAENLQECINGETYEVEEMYPAYNRVAESQGEQGAARSTHYALEAEKIHAVMYAEAKKPASQGKDIAIGTVFICPVCGYTVERAAPAKCPVCGAAKERFRSF